jgi:hypothetical protein
MFWLQDLKAGQAPLKTADSVMSKSANGRHRAHPYFKWHAIEPTNLQHSEFTLLILIFSGLPIKQRPL